MGSHESKEDTKNLGTVKIVCVGDSEVEKTSFMYGLVGPSVATEDIPGGKLAFVRHSEIQEYEGKRFELNYLETSGQEDTETLRKITYAGTNIFLIVFSVMKRKTFQSVLTKWAPEIEDICPAAGIVLVGLNEQQQMTYGGTPGPVDVSAPPSVVPTPQEYEKVTEAEARALAKDIGAFQYFEITQGNIEELNRLKQALAGIYRAYIPLFRSLPSLEHHVNKRYQSDIDDLEKLLEKHQVEVQKHTSGTGTTPPHILSRDVDVMYELHALKAAKHVHLRTLLDGKRLQLGLPIPRTHAVCRV